MGSFVIVKFRSGVKSSGEEVVGTLHVHSKRPHAFTESDIRFAKLIAYLAAGKLRIAYDRLMNSVTMQIDAAMDQYTQLSFQNSGELRREDPGRFWKTLADAIGSVANGSDIWIRKLDEPLGKYTLTSYNINESGPFWDKSRNKPVAIPDTEVHHVENILLNEEYSRCFIYSKRDPTLEPILSKWPPEYIHVFDGRQLFYILLKGECTAWFISLVVPGSSYLRGSVRLRLKEKLKQVGKHLQLIEHWRESEATRTLQVIASYLEVVNHCLSTNFAIALESVKQLKDTKRTEEERRKLLDMLHEELLAYVSKNDDLTAILSLFPFSRALALFR
jgi:hypothetical protein